MWLEKATANKVCTLYTCTQPLGVQWDTKYKPGRCGGVGGFLLEQRVLYGLHGHCRALPSLLHKVIGS